MGKRDETESRIPIGPMGLEGVIELEAGTDAKRFFDGLFDAVIEYIEKHNAQAGLSLVFDERGRTGRFARLHEAAAINAATNVLDEDEAIALVEEEREALYLEKQQGGIRGK